MTGGKYNVAILQYIKTKYKLLNGERTSEDIKVNVATVFAGGRDEEQSIRGRDIVSGLPRTITVNSAEIEEALREPVSLITDAAKAVLEQTSPELSADIIDRGVILTGGGAMIHGIDQLLSEELKVPVFLAEEPMNCVARGTGIMLENIDRIARKKII